MQKIYSFIKDPCVQRTGSCFPGKIFTFGCVGCRLLGANEMERMHFNLDVLIRCRWFAYYHLPQFDCSLAVS